MKVLQLAVGIALATTLMACAKAPSKNDIDTAVSKAMDQKSLCWVPQEGLGAKFPMNLVDEDVRNGNSDVLGRFIDGGLVELTEKRDYYMFTSSVKERTLTLTPKGETAKVWDPARGICMGRASVDKVINVLPEFDAGGGLMASSAGIVLSVKDVPEFLERSNPEAVAEFRKPESKRITMLKINDNWHVANVSTF